MYCRVLYELLVLETHLSANVNFNFLLIFLNIFKVIVSQRMLHLIRNCIIHIAQAHSKLLPWDFPLLVVSLLKQKKKRNFLPTILYFEWTNFNLIQNGGQKASPTSFSPLRSVNVKISPDNRFLDLINCQIGVKYQGYTLHQSQIIELEIRTSLKKIGFPG